MALTPEQLADLQGDLGIGADEAVFLDADLERLFLRAGEVHATAVWYGWRQLLAVSTKWIDYQVAQTKVSRSQAFEHIMAMVKYWAGESAAVTNPPNGFMLLGLTQIPPRYKEQPDGYYSERAEQERRGR